jgi:hypothetical protein
MKYVLLFIVFISAEAYAPVHCDRYIDKGYERVLEREFKAEQYEMFKEAVAYSESRGNPEAWNRFGYIGKYQFGAAARITTGFDHISTREFIRSPEVWPESQQEIAMDRLIEKHQEILSDEIAKYDGETLHGVRITKSGLLAAAHLAGAWGVKMFIEYGYNPSDAYGTRLTDYVNKFNDYKF